MSVELIAIKPLVYDKCQIGAGELFKASLSDARILKIVGMAADPPPAPQISITTDKPKRRYRRRDLEAEP